MGRARVVARLELEKATMETTGFSSVSRRALVLGALVALPSLATPAIAAPPVIRVSWPGLVRLVDRHPGVAAGRLRVEAARAAVQAARAVPNPELEGEVAVGESPELPGAKVEWALALKLPLGWIAQRGPRIEAADAEATAVAADASVLRRQVLLQLHTLFWNLVHAQEQVLALEALSSQTALLRRSVKLRVEKGEARPVEEVRIGVEAEKLAGELDRARTSRELRRDQLGLWLGLQPDQELVAAADIRALPRVPELERVRSRLLASHPALLASRARVQALSAELRGERRARVPSLGLSLFAQHEVDWRGYGIGLAAELPLWNWSSGRIARAQSLLAAGERQLEAERLELQASALEAQSACRGGVALAKRYRDQVLPRAESAAATVERTYQLGEATLLEVIDARRTLLETRRHHLGALAEAQVDCSRVRAALGEELP